MKIKNVYAIYFSPTGTTQKGVKAIAEGTGFQYKEMDLTLPKSRKVSEHSFASNELVVVGLPVYGGRLPKDIEDLFSVLKGDSTPTTAVVMYGNREYNDALIELKVRLEEKGFSVKAAAAFIGQHTFSEKIATGRPDADDLATARDFGRKTAEAIARDTFTKPQLKGDYSFKWKGYDPRVHVEFPPHPRLVTTENCTQCGLCAVDCPWEAIDFEDYTQRDYSKCMICYRCLKECPAEAIQVSGDKFLAYLPQFEARLTARRKEPELFLPV